MEIETILVNPSVYESIDKPNCIDLNNSFMCKNNHEIETPKYRRQANFNDSLKCVEILAKLYNVPASNCFVMSSGVAIATVIGNSGLFKRILTLEPSYSEMFSAYNVRGNARYIPLDFDDFQEGDLLCFESVSMPICKKNDYSKLVERIRKAGGKICIDNTIPTWYNYDCKDYNPDFIVESLSKFANGMNNSLAGFLYCKESKDLDTIRHIIQFYGFHLHPFDSYMLTLGLQTMSLRMKQIQTTSFRFKAFCENSGLVLNKDFTCYPESGLFFFNSDKTLKDLPKFKYLQFADTFGAPFSVMVYWKNQKIIRISIGLEDFNDLREDFVDFIDYVKNK